MMKFTNVGLTLVILFSGVAIAANPFVPSKDSKIRPRTVIAAMQITVCSPMIVDPGERVSIAPRRSLSLTLLHTAN